jgi:hypothetical protein
MLQAGVAPRRPQHCRDCCHAHSMSGAGQIRSPPFSTVMEELASIPDAKGGVAAIDGRARLPRRRVLPRKPPPRRATVISAVGQRLPKFDRKFEPNNGRRDLFTFHLRFDRD